MIKKILYTLIGMVIMVTGVAYAQLIPTIKPVQGGTGTSQIPTYGQVLVGTSGGVYTPVATSTLGISGGGSGTPSGSNGQLQYNGSGSFAGVSTTTVTAGTNVSFSPFTVIGSSPITISASGGGGTFPFTPQTYGVSTSTTVGFLNGILTTASSTFSTGYHLGTNTLIQNGQGYIQQTSPNAVNGYEIYNSGAGQREADLQDEIDQYQTGGQVSTEMDLQDNAENWADWTTSTYGGAAAVPIVIQACWGTNCNDYRSILTMLPNGSNAFGLGTTTVDQSAELQVASTTATRIFEADTNTGTHIFSVGQNGVNPFIIYSPVDNGNGMLTLQTAAGQSSIAFDTNSGANKNFTTLNNYGDYVVHNSTDNFDNIYVEGITHNIRLDAAGGNVGVGTTTPWKMFSVGTGNNGVFDLSTSTAGCANFSSKGELYSTGTNCGTTLNPQIPSGTVNGTNVAFSVVGNITNVYVNGQLEQIGTDYIYTSGAFGTITFSIAPPTSSILFAN